MAVPVCPGYVFRLRIPMDDLWKPIQGDRHKFSLNSSWAKSQYFIKDNAGAEILTGGIYSEVLISEIKSSDIGYLED